jgi:hypothetical protein
LVSALATWFVWAETNPLALVEDEMSYVLQARLFASGHWTAPSPPAPEFFQQSCVLTVPAVASKFPPGHALVLSLGALFDWPALVPLLLTALSGALLFALTRRVANARVALLAWVVWLGDPVLLRFRSSYFSELTTTFLWLCSWWALLEWRATRRRGWLLALAGAIGWGAITRPLTMLAFAIPVGIVVVRDVARTNRWSDLSLAVGLGMAILGILPLWSAKTTGDWRLSPLTLYTRDYLPYDKPGFGIDRAPPRRALSPVNRFTYVGFFNAHVVHTPANLPRIAWERLAVIAHDEWSGARLALAPFVVLGLFSLGPPVAFALACSGALFAAYLLYGHQSQWTLYYFEGLPVLSMLAALGMSASIAWVRGRSSLRSSGVHFFRGLIAHPVAVAIAPLVLLSAWELHAWRLIRQRNAAWSRGFEQLLSQLPKHPVVMFVHYAPRIGPHAAVVTNSPRLFDDPVWIVNDLGDRDAELMRYAGPRVPMAFDEDSLKIAVDRRLLGVK